MCEVRSAPRKKDGTPSEFYGYGGDIYGGGTGTLIYATIRHMRGIDVDEKLFFSSLYSDSLSPNGALSIFYLTK